MAATAKTTKKRETVRTKEEMRLDRYRNEIEALKSEIEQVHTMLDAVRTPPNAQLHARMVEFAKQWLRKCGPESVTHPAIAARSMLQAVNAPLWPLA